MDYELHFKPQSVKDLRKLSPELRLRILQKVEDLSHGLSGDVRQLTSFTPEYSLRVGDYRVLFELEEDRIVVYRIRHRREAYRR